MSCNTEKLDDTIFLLIAITTATKKRTKSKTKKNNPATPSKQQETPVKTPATPVKKTAIPAKKTSTPAKKKHAIKTTLAKPSPSKQASKKRRDKVLTECCYIQNTGYNENFSLL